MISRAAYRCYHTSSAAFSLRQSLLAGKSVKFGQKAPPKAASVEEPTVVAYRTEPAAATYRTNRSPSQTLSVDSSVVSPPPRRKSKPVPVDPEYTSYLSNIVDDSRYRDEQLKKIIAPNDVKTVRLAKRVQQYEMALHNAEVVPTGESRRVRRWLARNKTRRTRSDRNRNKQALNRISDEADDQVRNQKSLWKNRLSPEEEEEEMEFDDDMEEDDAKEHRARRQRVLRKEKALDARTHLMASKKRQHKKKEAEYV